MDRAALGAEAAADADGFVLDHDGALAGGQIARFEMLERPLKAWGVSAELLVSGWGKCEVPELQFG